MAVQRIQRELRVPAMENLVELVTDGTDTLNIPGDLLEVISLFTNNGNTNRRLIRCDLEIISRERMKEGEPYYFHRIRGDIILGPVPADGTKIYLNYYRDVSGLTADTDTNWLTEASPDLLIYGMLSYAADYYLDDRLKLWEDRYQSIAQDLQDMADRDELVGAVISPAHYTDATVSTSSW